MINKLIEVLNIHETMIFDELDATIEMLTGSIFIAVIAGFFIGMTLNNLVKVNAVMRLIILPLRIVMFVLGGYPVIVVAILMTPFIRREVGTIIGIEAAQPILMIWGAFYFATHLYRAFNNTADGENAAIKVVKSLRILVIGMISASAVLGMIGMGGLGGILLNYGFFRDDYNFALVIAVIYAAMILVVEFAAVILLTIFRPVRTAKVVEQQAETIRRTEKTEKERQQKAQKITPEPQPQSPVQKPMNFDSLIRRG